VVFGLSSPRIHPKSKRIGNASLAIHAATLTEPISDSSRRPLKNPSV
jgi:hypothetical protein